MKIGYIKVKEIKGWKRSVTYYQKLQNMIYYGSDGKKLRDGMNTKFNVYFIKGSKLPYSFYDYETVCHVGNFKSIDGMIKHIKKWGFIFQSVELEYIEEYKK
jgi:hypothetical protein